MKKLISNIINDTLKREKNGVRRWSKTALTMLTAWIMALAMAIDHQARTGFDYSVWIVFISVATGMKIADRAAKAIKSENVKE